MQCQIYTINVSITLEKKDSLGGTLLIWSNIKLLEVKNIFDKFAKSLWLESMGQTEQEYSW